MGDSLNKMNVLSSSPCALSCSMSLHISTMSSHIETTHRPMF